MEVLTFSDYYLPGYKAGGVVRSLANLVEGLGTEFDFRLVTRDRDAGDTEPFPNIPAQRWIEQGKGRTLYVRRGNLLADLQFAISTTKPDLIYLNSLFSPSFTALPFVLSRLQDRRTPVLVAPRGECSPGALELKRTKKACYLNILRWLQTWRSIVFQASTPLEAEQIRAVFPDADVLIAADIPTPPFGGLPAAATKSKGHASLCFLSRISPMKNLLYALDRLADLTGTVELDIFGFIDDPKHWMQCQQRIAELPSNVRVSYRGVLHPMEVQPTLYCYDALFVPTRGENFGHVFMEAFGAGVPVLVSDETPWRNLEAKGVGWDIPLSSPERFNRALDELLRWDDDDRASVRSRCLEFASEKYASYADFDAWRKMFARAGERS